MAIPSVHVIIIIVITITFGYMYKFLKLKYTLAYTCMNLLNKHLFTRLWICFWWRPQRILLYVVIVFRTRLILLVNVSHGIHLTRWYMTSWHVMVQQKLNIFPIFTFEKIQDDCKFKYCNKKVTNRQWWIRTLTKMISSDRKKILYLPLSLPILLWPSHLHLSFLIPLPHLSSSYLSSVKSYCQNEIEKDFLRKKVVFT